MDASVNKALAAMPSHWQQLDKASFWICRHHFKTGEPSNGISYYPFKNGKILAWDYTCPDSKGPTHIKAPTSNEASKAASLAESGKLKKYNHHDYHVILVGMLTLFLTGGVT